jgi:CRP-like cAMP-binding protein
MIRTNIDREDSELLLEILDSYYPLTTEDKELLLKKLVKVKKKKGDFLYKNNDKEAYIFFLIKGAVKAYNTNKDGVEEVYWFGFEGDICFSPQNYTNNMTYNENLVLYEDSVFYRIDVAYMKSLYSDNCNWANWGRCMAENLVVLMSDFADSQKFLRAKERYNLLLKEIPQIAQRVPLQDIASFLGITPVSLSRIRKDRT